MRRYWITALLGVGAALTAACASASHAAEAPARNAAMVIDANTGEVLHAQNADEPRHPASLTKMMTLYLAFEAIEQGRLADDTILTVSTEAASVAPSKLELEPGEQIALINAIKALITKSANDMAVAIAERISGSEGDFVRLMNERARQLGMRATTFRNASGLPDGAQITTARDMLTLALHLQDDFPKHYKLFSMRSFEYRGKSYGTHNTLMKSFPGIDGIKTGYTRASGFNLVSSVHRDGKHLVAAVFGGVTASARNAHMRMLLFHGLDQASTEKTRTARPMLVAAPKPASRPPTRVADNNEPRPVWMADDPVETKVAAVAPKPRPAQRAPAVAAVTPKIAASAPAAPAPAPAPPAPTAAARPEPAIQIAKVRAVPVIVATAQPAEATAPEMPTEVSPPPAPVARAEASAAPSFDFPAFRDAVRNLRTATAAVGPAPAADAPPGTQETIVTKQPNNSESPAARPPSTLQQQLALLVDATAAPPAAPEAMPAVLAASTETPRARPPSTLQLQAVLLTPASATAPAAGPAWHLEGPAGETPAANASAPAAAAGYQIQIGAYSNAAEAERRMSEARSRAANLLDGHASLTAPSQATGRSLFRARFAGFDQLEASETCLELRRQQFDCFVAKAE